MSINSVSYGFINMDWFRPWYDKYDERINGAVFINQNQPGQYTSLYTPGVDSSNNPYPIPKIFYSGSLNENYVYDSTGTKVYTFFGTNYFLNINYSNFNYGMYSINSSFKYKYPNYDEIKVNSLVVTDTNDNTYVLNFTVKTDIYYTEYDYILNKNIKNYGIELSDYNEIISPIDTTSNATYNLEYIIYYGKGTIIPENLRNEFSIDYNSALNPFTSKKAFNATYENIVTNNNTYYWQKYSNQYITPQNTGWIIIKILGTLK